MRLRQIQRAFRMSLGTVVVAAMCLGALTAFAPGALAQQTAIYDQLMQLLSAKMPESVLTQTVKSQPSALNFTPQQLINLKNAGASDALLTLVATYQGSGGAAPAATTATAAAAPASTAASITPATLPQCTAPAGDTNAGKKVIAIDEFDFSTVQTSVQAIFGTNQDIGKGIRAMLTSRLADENKVRIVERAKVDTVMREQDFAASNRVRKGTGSRIGQITGADAYLMGDIVVFGRDDRKIKAGGFGGRFGRGLGAAAGAFEKDKAVVVINYRLVDGETTEVIAQGEARGESQRRSGGAGGMILSGLSGGGGYVDMTSSNFGETIIGEATQAAVDNIATEFNANIDKVPNRNVAVEGRVASVTGGQVILNIGSTSGVGQCDRFELSKVLNEIKDPQTGEVLDVQTEVYGEGVATQVRDSVAYVTFSAHKMPEVGDIARKK